MALVTEKTEEGEQDPLRYAYIQASTDGRTRAAVFKFPPSIVFISKVLLVVIVFADLSSVASISNDVPTFAFSVKPQVNSEQTYSLDQFNRLFKMQLEALGVEADAFTELDEDEDGVLAGKEVIALQASLAHLEAEAKAEKERGALNEEKFVHRYEPWINRDEHTALKSNYLYTVFSMLDTDEDGLVDGEEIKSIGDWLDMDTVRDANAALAHTEGLDNDPEHEGADSGGCDAGSSYDDEDEEREDEQDEDDDEDEEWEDVQDEHDDEDEEWEDVQDEYDDREDDTREDATDRKNNRARKFDRSRDPWDDYDYDAEDNDDEEDEDEGDQWEEV